MINSSSIAKNISAEERLGRRLAVRLDAAAQSLPHDVSERLRVARQQALNQYRQLHKAQVAPALFIGKAGLALAGGSGEDEHSFWPRLLSFIALVAMVVGLLALQSLNSDQIAESLADIDSAILTDVLPPDAYADPGFAQYLKARVDTPESQSRP